MQEGVKLTKLWGSSRFTLIASWFLQKVLVLPSMRKWKNGSIGQTRRQKFFEVSSKCRKTFFATDISMLGVKFNRISITQKKFEECNKRKVKRQGLWLEFFLSFENVRNCRTNQIYNLLCKLFCKICSWVGFESVHNSKKRSKGFAIKSASTTFTLKNSGKNTKTESWKCLQQTTLFNIFLSFTSHSLWIRMQILVINREKSANHSSFSKTKPAKQVITFKEPKFIPLGDIAKKNKISIVFDLAEISMKLQNWLHFLCFNWSCSIHRQKLASSKESKRQILNDQKLIFSADTNNAKRRFEKKLLLSGSNSHVNELWRKKKGPSERMSFKLHSTILEPLHRLKRIWLWFCNGIATSFLRSFFALELFLLSTREDGADIIWNDKLEWAFFCSVESKPVGVSL